jgi:hypothetical protein
MKIFGKLTHLQKSAIKYFADCLFTPQMQSNITIRICYSRKMQNYGETHIVDYNEANKPRDFDILIKKRLGEQEIIKTIAHEMVHVKQYVYGELNEYMSMWKGTEVSEDDYDYYDSPWEIEAFELENKLYNQFNKSYK